MACFGTFQYVICGIYGLINVKIVLNKATDAFPVKKVLTFFHINLSGRWTKILIGRFKALILPFKIFSILSALISSAKSEYDREGICFLHLYSTSSQMMLKG